MSATFKTHPVAQTENRRIHVVRREPVPLCELSIVVLTAEARTIEDNEIVPAGTEGTIVAVHGGGIAYAVEVEEPAGVVTVRADEVRAK